MIKLTSQAIIAEFKRRQVPIEVVAEEPFTLMRYFHKGHWHFLRSSMPESSSAIGKLISDEKQLAAIVAAGLQIPVPSAIDFSTLNEAEAFLNQEKVLVVKPADGSHGNGVTVGVKDAGSLHAAIGLARSASRSDRVVLQKKIEGFDLRLLVIDGQFVAAARRVPGAVTGDGRHTLRQLIEHENTTNLKRGHDYENVLNKIDIEAAERFWGDRIDSEIPAANTEVAVVGTANIGTGGRSIDYTDRLPQSLITAAEQFARTTRLTACGVDFLWDEVSGEFCFIEANACPSFGLHLRPSEGKMRPVDALFVDALLK
jgi:cyanophycin synthetase